MDAAALGECFKPQTFRLGGDDRVSGADRRRDHIGGDVKPRRGYLSDADQAARSDKGLHREAVKQQFV
jgi:hypothetical protein